MRSVLVGAVVLNVCRILILISAVYMRGTQSIFSHSTTSQMGQSRWVEDGGVWLNVFLMAVNSLTSDEPAAGFLNGTGFDFSNFHLISMKKILVSPLKWARCMSYDWMHSPLRIYMTALPRAPGYCTEIMALNYIHRITNSQILSLSE